MARPPGFEDLPFALDELPWGPYRAITGAVHDADTFSFLLSIGFDNYTYESIRLSRVRAPELSQSGGEEMRRFALELCPPGTPCIVHTEKTPVSHREARSFTRYIGHIFLADGRDVNAEIQAEIDRAGYGPGL